MLVTVPQTGAIFPYDPLTGLNGFRDFAGMGQTTDNTFSAPDTTSTFLPVGNVSASSLNIENPFADLSDDSLTTDPSTLLGTVGAVTPAITPPATLASATGPVSQAGAAVTPSTSGLMTGPTPTAAQLAGVIQNGTGAGVSAAQIAQIFTSAASAGIAVFKATSSPSLIPGTSLVYNPATGQVANASTGLTGSQLATTLGVGSMSIGTILLLGGAAVLLLMMTSKK
jgi:hypothetical protein